MNILKDLPELIKTGVINEETAVKIRAYYGDKSGSSTNWLFVVFGVLGGILVGLGIILIIAHNWDELSRPTKTFLAFAPLVIAQIICGYALLKKPDNITWRESGTVFLFFSVGASISLVSQIYHMPGELSSFLLLWMLLCLPLIYVMRSSVASLLYLIGIAAYGFNLGFWSYDLSKSYMYWLLLLMALPHYYLLYKHKPRSNFMIMHNWLIPISIGVFLETIGQGNKDLMVVAYVSLFGLFYMIGNLDFFKQQKARNNGYKIMGSLGTIAMLLTLSFDWFWENLRQQQFQFNEVVSSPEFLVAAFISLLALGLLYLKQKGKPLSDIKPMGAVFVLFIITFILGLSSPIAAFLINLYIFIIGLLTIRDGARQNHLGILNYGLLIITALVTCRFFDTDLSFITRGILFMSVGAGFFVTNYWMLKKRKTNDQ